MAKGKNATVFFCQSCGYESGKWMGQCPGCRQWNTFVEETVIRSTKSSINIARHAENKPATLSEISLEEEDRISTRMR
ncbi:MAG: DNA repair protein RadA, partial [Lachnospiraceae bacterium]|nr:DNA repair protein RadA [Lachnospiraceae bacterium]